MRQVTMKAQIALTIEDGTIFEGEVELSPVDKKRQQRKRRESKPTNLSPSSLNFSMNERAFIKRHAKNLSGSRKFVLILAYLVKGEVGPEIELKDIEKHWSKMTASNLLGMEFNYFYASAAKEDGWADTKKKGFYFLCPTWKQVLKS